MCVFVCVCVCVCLCVSVCVMCVSVCVMCVCLCKILVPPNNFQTAYPIDTNFWLHIGYNIVPELSNAINPISQFWKLCPGKHFEIHFFSIQLTWGNLQTHITPLIYALDDWHLLYRYCQWDRQHLNSKYYITYCLV